MLQYASCLAILAVEMLVCSAIILPLPQGFRRTILESISKVWNTQPRFRWFVKFINLVILGMFLDSAWGVYRSYSFSDAPHIADTAGDKGKDVTLNLFESERNMIMSLFILFLFMLIYRFQSMIHLVVKLEKELDAPDQYKGQEVSYKRIKTQNEELERALEKHGVSPVVDYTDKETKTM